MGLRPRYEGNLPVVGAERVFGPATFPSLTESRKIGGIRVRRGCDRLDDSRDSRWAEMDHRAGGSAAAFEAYVEALVGVIGHADRAEPLRDYCLGLMMPVERKSVEPIAALTAPARVSAKHQSLLHFVGQSPWSDEALLAQVRDWVLPLIERHGPVEAWIVDDTGFPKKGKHSVGVTRQYCGQLGKQDNCQVAVSLSVASATASLPIAYRLYLPEIWAENSRAAPESQGSRRYRLSDQAADRTRPDQSRQGCRRCTRRRPGRCGLWCGRRVPRRPFGARPRVCRRRAADAQCLAPW